MKQEYRVETPTAYQAVIADIFTKSNRDTLVLALSGDLGAGKTTFTQELAKHLGVAESVTSPTFTIMKQYDLTGGDFDCLVHIDAYRLESESEAGPLRLSEIFAMPRTIVCIEWPERIASYIPETALRVLITIGDNECRQVLVEDENQ
jgi:tRNA threonylcarbamoyladenosine biosynthesis protein TsaE